MALTRGRDPRHRRTPQVRDDVQLRAQPAPRPTNPFPIKVFRPRGLRILDIRLNPRRDRRGQHVRIDINWRLLAGAGRVLVGADHRGVYPDDPLALLVAVTTGSQTIEHQHPGAVRRPPPVPVVDGLPVAVGRRQVPPRTARTSPPQNAIDHLPVVDPLPTPARSPVRQKRFHLAPFLIAQVMTIMHAPGLPHPALNHSRDTP